MSGCSRGRSSLGDIDVTGPGVGRQKKRGRR